MKIKSELYTYEIALLYRGIQLQLNECEKEIAEIRRKARIGSVLMFWRRDFIYFEASIKGHMILKSATKLAEIRDKLMQSEGIDEDMQPITFKKILERQHMQD